MISTADGHGRSEAGVAVLMQRKRDARRVYGTIVGTGTSCDGYKINGCQSHCRQLQVQLYKDIYRTFNIDPLQVTYVEAHGYGTKVSRGSSVIQTRVQNTDEIIRRCLLLLISGRYFVKNM